MNWSLALFMFLRLGLFSAEMFLAFLMFFHKANRRKYFILKLIVFVILIAGIAFGIACFHTYLIKTDIKDSWLYSVFVISGYLSLTSIESFVIYFLFDINIPELLSGVAYGYAIRQICFSIYISFMTAVYPDGILLRYTGLSLINGAYYAGFYIMLYSVCFFAIAGNVTKNGLARFDKTSLVFLSISIVAHCIITSVGEYYSADYDLMFILLHFACILEITLMLFAENYIEKNEKLKADNRIANHLLQSQKEQYKFSQANAELLHVKAHDLKHQIKALRKGGEEAEKVLSDLEGVISSYESVIITENQVMNVILSEKWLYCQKNNIKLSCTVDPGALKGMDNTDVYTLLGNILDNCIEAVSQIKDEKKRLISLTIAHNCGLSSINTQNYFEGRLEMINGIPQTNKKDHNEHGFGIKSIHMIATKYHGSMNLKTEEDVFNLQILIPDEA